MRHAATDLVGMDAEINQLPEKGPNLVAGGWVINLQNLAKGDHTKGLLLQRYSQLLALLQQGSYSRGRVGKPVGS